MMDFQIEFVLNNNKSTDLLNYITFIFPSKFRTLSRIEWFDTQ